MDQTALRILETLYKSVDEADRLLKVTRRV